MPKIPAVAVQPDPTPLEIRLSLFENGYHPVLARGKVSDVTGWRTPVASFDEIIELTQENRGHLNTGLLCGSLVALDIDALDPETSAVLLDMARALPDADKALQRVGKAPKVTLLFRATAPGKKLATKAYRVNGFKCQVEIMGNGQQVIGFGIHPDTQEPYHWVGPSPLDAAFADLPEITPEAIAGFVAEAEAYLAEHGELITATRPSKSLHTYQPTEQRAPAGDGIWAELKAKAMANLGAWVPDLGLTGTKTYADGYLARADFRPSTSSTGKTGNQRGLSVCFSPEGIVDYADGNRGWNPIDIAAEVLGINPSEAADWLRARVGDERPAADPSQYTGLIASAAKKHKYPEPRSLVAANDNIPATPAFSIFDWTGARFVGEPPVVEELIDSGIPLGVPAMVAAMGDTGKSYALLNLHQRVAFGSNIMDAPIFGGRVKVTGTAVMVTAEDDAGEVHRRLAALDERGQRFGPNKDRMIVVPLPSAGGPQVFWRDDRRQGLVETDAWKRLCDQLASIQDLRVVTLDPLASFAHVALNEDPAAGAFVCASIGRLAAETGATTFVAHHMKKTGRTTPIESLADAREAIRGSTALVDGLRLAYALWPAEEKRGKAVCKEVGVTYSPNRVVLGGVVKANGAARRIVSTYVRNEFGLLVDRTASLGANSVPQEDMIEMVVEAIAAAAESGHPYTKTGATGLFEQRDRLPEEMRSLSKHRLEVLAQEAIDKNRVVKCLAGGTTVKWLDVPGGSFAIGLGQFRKGMVRA